MMAVGRWLLTFAAAWEAMCRASSGTNDAMGTPRGTASSVPRIIVPEWQESTISQTEAPRAWMARV
jgi:hypothetical protein